MLHQRPRRLRLRPSEMERPRHRLPALSRDADGARRRHDDSQLRADGEAENAKHLRRPDRAKWHSSAFGVFLLRQFMLAIHSSLDEAASIDGATKWQLFWDVILPLSRPGLITLAIFAFLGNYGSLFWPLVMVKSEYLRTLPVGMMYFDTQYGRSDQPHHGRQRDGDPPASAPVRCRAKVPRQRHPTRCREGLKSSAKPETAPILPSSRQFTSPETRTGSRAFH